MAEAPSGGVILFRQRAQTHWMSSPSVQRGVYQSLGVWDLVLALNYGTCEDRIKPGVGGSGVLLVVALYGMTSWTLPYRYLFFPDQQSNVGFQWGTESTLLQKFWDLGRRRALEGMMFWGESHILQVASIDPLIAWIYMPPNYWQPSWRIGMCLYPKPWRRFQVRPVL